MKTFWIVVITLLAVAQLVCMFFAWRVTGPNRLGTPAVARPFLIVLWPILFLALLTIRVQ